MTELEMATEAELEANEFDGELSDEALDRVGDSSYSAPGGSVSRN